MNGRDVDIFKNYSVRLFGTVEAIELLLTALTFELTQTI